MNSTRDFFDDMAPRWDEITQARPGCLEYVVSHIDVSPAGQILDAGCGTGVLLPFLSQLLGPDGKLYAVDISPAMLDRAREKHAHLDINYLEADLGNLPLSENSLDAVVCFNMFPHIDDRAGALSEVHRTLKPKGTVVIAHDASRKDVNSRHHKTGGHIRTHMLPDGPSMAHMLREAGLAPLHIEDAAKRYLVKAEKPL